jgi:beta-glucosidase
LAQRQAIVLLKNAASPGGVTLPLRGQPKIYLENIAAEVVAGYGQIVTDVAEADFAILRLDAPYEPRQGDFLESLFHAGSLALPEAEEARLLSIMAQVPTIMAIFLDRPAVIPRIAAQSAGLLADFGASDAAVLDVIFGRFQPSGKLPFEMPSSLAAVQRQKADVPYDSDNPLFPFGHGLSYPDIVA